MEFVIVTGLAGAGKSRALHALEDIDYYCVDNIPPKLIPTFYDLCMQSKNDLPQVAVVTDSRGGKTFQELPDQLDRMKAENKKFKILFLDCDDEILLRRYKETRRKHPLSDMDNDSLDQCVRLDRELLTPLRARTDYLLDTSHVSPVELKEQVTSLFLGGEQSSLVVQFLSFGFKYGTPNEADLLFDVRCLPNPYYIDELRKQTGLQKPVRDYVMACPDTQTLLSKLDDLISFLLPLYEKEGKRRLVVAIGCTGGKHRSVAIAEYFFGRFMDKTRRTKVTHRDISK